MIRILMPGASCVSLAAATLAFAAPAPRPMTQSPLLASWAGPNGGVPAFDKVKVSDFEPAFQQSIAREFETVNGIANNPAAPTFANTILAL
jgi:peptidyl-dipeptidase Dcp